MGHEYLQNNKITKKWIYISLLFLLIVFHFINNYIWLRIDCISLGCDVVWHLLERVRIFNQLKTIFNERLGIERFLALFEVDGTTCWPKLVHLFASIINSLFGNTDFVTRLSNIIYFIILIFSVYK